MGILSMRGKSSEMKDAKMGMKRKFDGRVYSLVAVSRNKSDLATFAKNQRKVGGRVRITKNNWGRGVEYTVWHGGYR